LPLTRSWWNSDFTVQGWTPERAGSDVHHREIMPGYLEAMRVPLRRGRVLDERDRGGAESTVLINETLADRYFANEDPVGKRIAFDRVAEPTSVWRTIVGVVGDERQWGVAEAPRPEFLAPFAQDWRRMLTLVIRTQDDPRALLPAVRAQIRALDAALPDFDVRTMEEVHAASLARERFVMMLFGLFAFLALLLALVGVYGVVAQSARARVQEMGIRLALGARPAEVQKLIAGRAIILAAVGITIGLICALAFSGWLGTLLHEMQPNDPATYAGVALLLAGAAILASWLPAWRSSRKVSISALRPE
jgi:predicted permease